MPIETQKAPEVVILDRRRQWRLISAIVAWEDEEEGVSDAAQRPPPRTMGDL